MCVCVCVFVISQRLANNYYSTKALFIIVINCYIVIVCGVLFIVLFIVFVINYLIKELQEKQALIAATCN